MRGITKILTATVAVGLAASVAACSSSGSDAKPVATVKDLSGGISTTVVAASSFVSALKTLGVTPGLVGKATSPAAGQFTFPITGGNVTVYKKGEHTPYVEGSIEHDGSGLSLTAGGTKVVLENFDIDPGNNSKLTGDVIVNGGSPMKGVKLFDLDGGTLQPISISNGVATLQGTTIYLSSDAAKALNGVFKLTGAKALKGGVGTGVKIGTAILKVKA